MCSIKQSLLFSQKSPHDIQEYKRSPDCELFLYTWGIFLLVVFDHFSIAEHSGPKLQYH